MLPQNFAFSTLHFIRCGCLLVIGTLLDRIKCEINLHILFPTLCVHRFRTFALYSRLNVYFLQQLSSIHYPRAVYANPDGCADDCVKLLYAKALKRCPQLNKNCTKIRRMCYFHNLWNFITYIDMEAPGSSQNSDCIEKQKRWKPKLLRKC